MGEHQALDFTADTRLMVKWLNGGTVSTEGLLRELEAWAAEMRWLIEREAERS
jgi:hypothetical protein